MPVHNPTPPTFSWNVEEQPFLDAIRRDIFDDEAKLVYADWLDERGDHRAAILRSLVDARSSNNPVEKADGVAEDWLNEICYPIFNGIAQDGSLHDVRDEILKLARPIVAIDTEPTSDAEIPIGASKFNGDPDLPPAMVWPEYEESWPKPAHQAPLLFLAQISLTEIRGLVDVPGLPESGLLSIFGAMGDGIEPRGEKDDTQIFYFPENEKLERRPQPEEHKEWASYFKSGTLTFKRAWDLPNGQDDWSDVHSPIQADSLQGLESEEIEEAVCTLREDIWSDHHMFGYSVHSRTSNPSPGDDWLHLLCLGSDLGWSWCDGEHLAIFVNREDLAAGKFERLFGYCS